MLSLRALRIVNRVQTDSPVTPRHRSYAPDQLDGLAHSKLEHGIDHRVVAFVDAQGDPVSVKAGFLNKK